MEESRIHSAIRGFIGAWMEGDVQRASSYFTEDAVWTTPQGSFQGRAGVERYARWALAVNRDLEARETDGGFIVHEGRAWKLPAFCHYTVRDGRIASLRTYMDLLSQADQLSPGGLARLAVGAIQRAVRKGL